MQHLVMCTVISLKLLTYQGLQNQALSNFEALHLNRNQLAEVR